MIKRVLKGLVASIVWLAGAFGIAAALQLWPQVTALVLVVGSAVLVGWLVARATR